MTLSIANHHASLPVAYQLYLPKDWAQDDVRRKKAHIPATVGFKTKPQIALEQLLLGVRGRASAECRDDGPCLRQRRAAADQGWRRWACLA